MNQFETTEIRNSLASPGRTLLAFGLIALLTLGLLALDSQPANGHHALQVSVGWSHTCVVTSGGAVECWGNNDYGQTDAPSGRFSQVSAGQSRTDRNSVHSHSCAVTSSGGLECWGANDYGQTDAPSGRFSQVSAGHSHTCAVTTGGAVQCWGWNGAGQTDAPAGRFSQVSAGLSHTCAVTTDGAVECWGYNLRGQTDAPSGHFSQVSAGHDQSCAVTSSGELECWGWNISGKADAPAGRFSQVSAGDDHTCAVTTGGAVECWGLSNFGRTDAPSGRFGQVSAGADHSCAVTSSGELECWGENGVGQRDVPSGRFSQVSAGWNHSCAVTSSGELECWGANNVGQTDAPSGRFSQVSAGDHQSCAVTTGGAVLCWGLKLRPPSGRFSQVSAGYSKPDLESVSGRSCAVTSSGELECWGQDYGRQTDVPSGRFSQVSVGHNHSCAVTTGGAVECWGGNGVGQRDVPSGRFSQVSVGWDHSCAVTSGGAVECWGGNGVGQRDAPSGRFSQVSVGHNHSCAVTTGGAVECWGGNGVGQRDAPSGRFSQVSAGGSHTCAITSGGAVQCWGADLLYGTSFARGHAPQAQSASLTARIAVRRLADGRIEFALQAPNERRILPGTRHFPKNAPVGRWLSASTIDYHGEPLGRINARRLADGRTEFSFVTPEGERLLPSGRLLPANPSAGWKRSTEIEIPLPGCRLSDPIENGFTFPTRNVTIDDSGDVYRVTGVPLKWSYTPAAKWLRIGSDVRYLVCGDEPPTDQEYDRALFTAGYYYSTDPDGDSAYLFAVTEGLERAENGYQAYLDHFEALRWVTGFNTVVQIVHVGLAVGVAPGSAAGLLTQHSAHPAAARVIGETLIPTLTDVVLDEALHLSQEALDAVQQQPEEVVKNLAWNYVVDARAWGNSWERETHDGREGAQVRRVDTSKPTNPPTYKFVTEYDTLHFDTAQLLNRIELDIALGAAGSQLNAVLKEEERKLWKKAFLNTIPLLGDVVSLYNSFQNIYESLEQQLFRSLSEQLEVYPPFNLLKLDLQNAAALVEQRQQDVIERLGIHAGNLQ